MRSLNISKGMPKVLLIRAKAQGEAALAHMQSCNIPAELVSLSDISYPSEKFKDFDFKDFEQIIISSSNALPALTKAQKDQIKTKVILSVTKALDGFTNIICFKRMEELVEYLKQQEIQTSILYLRGNYTSLTKPQEDVLKSLNCRYEFCYKVSYHDREFGKIADNLRKGSYSDILFFSKKSSEYFLELIKAEGLEQYLLNIKLCCISERVADVFKHVMPANIVIAKQPNFTDLIKCLDYPLAKS